MIDQPTETPELREMHNYAPWASVVAGLAVFTLRYASPRGTFDVHWNLFVTGIVIMFAALATTIAHGQSRRNYWSVICVAAGAWLLVSTSLIRSVSFVTTGQVVLGIVTIVCGCASVVGEIVAERRHIAH